MDEPSLLDRLRELVLDATQPLAGRGVDADPAPGGVTVAGHFLSAGDVAAAAAAIREGDRTRLRLVLLNADLLRRLLAVAAEYTRLEAAVLAMRPTAPPATE